MPEDRKDKKTIRLIAFNLFIFFIAIYLLTASGLNFYNTDAGQLRFEVTRSIVEEFDVSIKQGVVGLIGPDGRKHSWLGIGSAILAIPFYMIGKVVSIPPENAISLMNQIFGAVTVILIFLFSTTLCYSKRASLLISIFYGLGTMAWPLAKQPFDHTIETFFILLSVYCLYQYLNRRKFLFLVFSSFSLGVAFITRATSILIAPALFIIMFFYQIKENDLKMTIRNVIRDIILISLFFSPFLCLSLWYNYYRFSSIFETGYRLIAERAGISLFTGTSFLTGLSGLLISPGKGYFYYSPVAILFFFSIKSFMKRHVCLGISFVYIMISYLLFFSKYFYWHGDWAWGPRYLLALTPFLIIPIAEIFDLSSWKKKFMRVVIYSIFTVGLVIQIVAVSVDFQKYFVNSQFEEKVEFIEIYGHGVTSGFQPPSEIYFDLHMSPILAQVKFIYTIAKEIQDYRYLKQPNDISKPEKATQLLFMNTFDFWWIYKYYVNGSHSGFISVPLLILLSIYSGLRLLKLTRRF